MTANRDDPRSRSVSLRYELRQNVICVRITDVLDANEIMAFYAELAVDPAWSPGMPFLVDVRGVEQVAPLRELEATALASRRAKIFSVPTRSAALVSSEWMSEVVQRWAQISGAERVETRPFYGEDEARTWLNGA